ncbi:MAG: hypothetical protein EWV85_23530, partial [Microcystis aeruginosa Ma_QC_C_20070703_M131]
MPSKLYISTDGDIGLALKRNNNLRFNAFSPEYLYSFPTYCLSMASTTTTTTAGSSSQNRCTIAPNPIGEQIKTALGGKKLEKLSAKELDEFLDRDLLGEIGLDTEGKKKPKKGNNDNSSPISSPTAKTASTVSLPDLVGSFGTINLPTTVDFGAT